MLVDDCDGDNDGDDDAHAAGSDDDDDANADLDDAGAALAGAFDAVFLRFFWQMQAACNTKPATNNDQTKSSRQ